ncbi:reverse transcriptase domain-containing protein [Tanacetum coccineum]
MIYPISDSPWVSLVHCVPKKGGNWNIVVANEDNELIPTCLVTGWRVCIDYRKLNEATRKYHFPLPFMDQMLERLAGNEFYCFLDGFLGYFQIPIDPQDQEKTTFTCPYGTFAYRRMPFGLCNAPGTFQRCMMAIFHDMIEKTMEVFMDDFTVFGDSFDSEGIVLGHKISKSGIEVDRTKVNVIAKLPHPTTVKGVRSFLGHAGFYRRFIQDFSKIARPMTHLLEKETPFVFSKDCTDAFQTLKKKLTEAPILVIPDWNLPFELMCDANQIIRRCVHGQEANDILKVCHEGPIGGHHSANITAQKVKYGVTLRLATVITLERLADQVEVSNRGLKRILERTVGENCASWSDKLDDAFPRSIEHIGALKTANFDLKNHGTKKLHDSKIKNRILNVGDRVLLFNSHLKIFSGKLKTGWSGPFTITKVFPYGTIELSQPDGPNFKVNGHRVKHYFGEDLPPKPTYSARSQENFRKAEDARKAAEEAEKNKKANKEAERKRKAMEDKRAVEEQERKRKAEQDRKNAECSETKK